MKAVTNNTAREFVGARLTDLVNNTATHMAEDGDANINRNLEIVRNVLAHALDTVLCIGGAPVTMVLSTSIVTDDDQLVMAQTSHIFKSGEIADNPLCLQDFAWRLVVTDAHVVSIA